MLNELKINPNNNNFITLFNNYTLRVWSSTIKEKKLLVKIENVYCSNYTPDGKLICSIIYNNSQNYIHILNVNDFKNETYAYSKLDNGKKVNDIQVIYGNLYSIVILFESGQINIYDFCTLKLEKIIIQNEKVKHLDKLNFINCNNNNYLNILLKKDEKNYLIFDLKNLIFHQIEENEKNNCKIDKDAFFKYGEYIYNIIDDNIHIFKIENK